MENKNRFVGFELFVDGKNFFPEILTQISKAKESIKINMFIWRCDNIGLAIAKELLKASFRGVQIDISVDRYGLVHERDEESMQSFFHEKPTLKEKLKIFLVKFFYKTKKVPFEKSEEAIRVRKELLSRPNVKIQRDIFKADHSKFYLIDNNLLYLGGINIEDKEQTVDFFGRPYQDYMVKITDNRAIERFLQKIQSGKSEKEGYYFGINAKKFNPPLFEIEDLYLQMIKDAKEELHIIMAYLSPLKNFISAIKKAHERGVKITVMIPKKANFLSDLNLKAVKKILKITNNEATVYLSPKMVHTKLVATEKQISLGSCNINKKAFKQLDELNLFVNREECDFINDILSSMQENYDLSEKVGAKQIKYNPLRALIESILM